MSGLRTFIAVPLPGAIRARLLAVTDDLAPQVSQVSQASRASQALRASDVRWLRRPENFHVTIRFLGQVAEGRIPDIAAALSLALGDVPHFEIGVRGVGAFPSPRRANVIWADIDDPGAGLAALSRVVDTAVVGLGIPEAEGRPFRAHVTLGRSKAGLDARAALASASQATFGRFVVTELHLYESQRTADGSTYVLRSRAALKR